MLCLAVAAIAGALAVILRGSDADWDLRNYHLYNAFALWQGRIGRDLAPAQAQTFLAPGLDLIYVALLSLLNTHPAGLGAVLALPQGFAAFLAWCLARRMVPEAVSGRDSISGAAALIGATGVAGATTLATAQSEMIPACCVLGAILALARMPDPRGWALAGGLSGVAAGFKLTTAPFAAGLIVAAVLSAEPGRRRLAAIGWFTAAALPGAALTGGWWWAWLWIRFHDPVFPFFNQVFRSPWAAPVSHADVVHLPQTIWQAVAYPLLWGFNRCPLVFDVPVRDPRIALGWIAALVVLGRALWRWRRPERTILAVLTVWIVGYILWEVQFSILRYAQTLELMTGGLLLAAFAPLLQRTRARTSVAAAWAAAACLIAVTLYPNIGRGARGPDAVIVRPPPFQPGSLVVLLDGSPMAYVAAFVPNSVRFVGAHNNLVEPGAPDRLASAVAAAIRNQRGPLWGLEGEREIADGTLRLYHLVRAGDCVRVRSNLDNNTIRACPLRRAR